MDDKRYKVLVCNRDRKYKLVQHLNEVMSFALLAEKEITGSTLSLGSSKFSKIDLDIDIFHPKLIVASYAEKVREEIDRLDKEFENL